MTVPNSNAIMTVSSSQHLFRRLQNKTQVFPLPGSVFVHNRLTHSLEVSCVGRSLGNDVASQLLKKHPALADSHILGNRFHRFSRMSRHTIWEILLSVIREKKPFQLTSRKDKEWH